jgi:hypothetical protein
VKGPNAEGNRSRLLDRPSESDCLVIIWDEHRHRRQEINKIIVSTKMQPIVIERSSSC